MAVGMSITNYNTAQLQLGDNFLEQVSYSNSTGNAVTIPLGRLMGRILATNKVLPNISSATDGSELPIGVTDQEYIVPDGETWDIWIITGGEVNKNLVVLGSGDTYATAVRTVSTGGGTIQDLITRNTQLQLIATTDASAYDNQ
jgi:hypothetical protein